MDWIKNAILDIAVTVVIALAVFTDMSWARWIIGIYSPFILLLVALAFAGAVKPKASGVPPAVHHVLYAVNLLLLVYDRWWWIAGCWVAIWILSSIMEQRQRK